MRSGQGKSGRRMIERRAVPVGGRVALLTSLGEARLHVIRIGRALEIGQVALHTSPARETVRAARTEGGVVALRALQGNVCPRQRESGGGVIKAAAGPVRRVMALLAGLREPRLHVIRIGRALEIRQVALHTSSTREAVRATRAECRVMALRALQRSMRPGQGKSGRRVIESRTLPGGRAVALLAGLRESGLHVIRIGRALEIGQVALHTSSTREAVRATRAECRVMTLRALQRSMRPGQREPGRAVIEGRAVPVRRAVALFTSLREPGLDVIGIGRALEIGQVALHACRAAKAVGAARTEGRVMALRALQRSVRSRQRESCRRVIKRCASPGRCAVALLAGLREARLHVIWSGCLLEIRQMAADASRVRVRQVVIVVRMALTALQAGMRAGQREARRGVIEGGVIPGRRVMALLASRWETRLHVIGTGRILEVLHVARCAVGCRSHKLAVGVALGASHVGVRTGQRELRKSIVVKRCRIPRAGVVTSLASRREASLRVRRIISLVEVRHVAAAAGCRRPRELSTRVAGIAIQSRVRAHQRKARNRKVVKLRAHPVVHGVALIAPRGELESDVVQAG